jgi:hypothetical protein
MRFLAISANREAAIWWFLTFKEAIAKMLKTLSMLAILN